MNKERALKWTEIEIAGDDTGNNSNIQLDLSKDPNDNDDESNEQQKSQNTESRRVAVSGIKDQKIQAQNDKDDSEETEDQDERTQRQGKSRYIDQKSEDSEDTSEPKKKNRAHKRIQSLLAQVRVKDAELQEERRLNQTLASRSKLDEKRNVKSQKEQWSKTVEDKEAALEAAMNDNRNKDVAKLTTELADAKMRLNAYEAVHEELEAEPEVKQENQRQQQQQQAPEVPEAAQEWVGRNPWFKTDGIKQGLARMISAQLTQEGELDPEDDEYWQEMDTRLGEYGVKSNKNKQKDLKDERSGGNAGKRRSPVGSSREDEDYVSTDRSGGKQFSRQGNKVTAQPSSDDYDMAERLGVPINNFMKEKYKLAQQDYKGYVTIDIPGQ